jgi:hypothetical protein
MTRPQIHRRTKLQDQWTDKPQWIMGDYYRRDRHESNPRDGGRGYARDEEHRSRDYYSDRRDSRYSPPPRSRSRERYQERGRDDDSYHAREHYRDRRDDRDRSRESYDRENTRPPVRDEREEQYPRPSSPHKRHSEDFDIQPPSGPRADRYKEPHEDSYNTGKPNSQIIFRGLDKDMTETDVSDFLSFRTITDFHSYNNFFSTKALQLKV